MDEVILVVGDRWLMCSLQGVKAVFTDSDDPKFHYVLTLRNPSDYKTLKNRIIGEYEQYKDCNEGFYAAIELLWTDQLDDLTVDDGYCYKDIRTRVEICKYMEEACDKVWLMRTRPCEDQQIEGRRLDAIDRIFSTYNDIPDEGYTDWECGYWNGILGALRWVLGDEKDFLDT